MKDKQIHIRVSDIEKEKFRKEAEKRGMDLSTFFLSAARAEVLRDTTERIPAGEASGLLQDVLEKIDRLERMIQGNDTRILEAIQSISSEEREDLALAGATDKIFWMLKQKQFQQKKREEIKKMLLAEDPSLKEFVTETPKRLFSALDLALEKLQEEGLLEIGRQGILHWKD